MPYLCYALMHPVYGPAMRIIASITNAQVPTATTTFAHNYVTGTIVRFDIPPALGMQQLNHMTAFIVVTGPTTFTFSVSTYLFDTFVIPVASGPHVDICGLVVPVGSTNNTLAPAVINQLNPTI